MLDELKQKLNDEAEELLHELNVELPHEIEKAVEKGDLRENAEYSAALERQQQVQARLDHIARRLGELSEIDLDELPEDRVGFGSVVTVRDLDDESVEEYRLAFGDDIDFEKGEVSMESPIGKALLGREEGDEVTVSLPAGRLRYRIEELVTLPSLTDEDGAEAEGEDAG